MITALKVPSDALNAHPPSLTQVPPHAWHVASTWKRYFAMLIDGFAVTTLDYLAFASFSGVSAGDPMMLAKKLELEPLPQQACFPILILIALSYQMLPLRRFGATPGKLLFGLRIVQATPGSEERLSWRMIFLRTVSGFLLLPATLGMLPQMFALFNLERRQLFDFIAGTRVVQASPRRSEPKKRWVIGVPLFLMGILVSAVQTLSLLMQLTPGMFPAPAQVSHPVEPPPAASAPDQAPEQAQPQVPILSADQQAKLDALYAAAFEAFKNRNYNETLRLSAEAKVIHPAYKDFGQMERYALEGKKKLEELQQPESQ